MPETKTDDKQKESLPEEEQEERDKQELEEEQNNGKIGKKHVVNYTVDCVTLSWHHTDLEQTDTHNKLYFSLMFLPTLGLHAV